MSAFKELSLPELGKVVGRAAFMHHIYRQKDPKFEAELNSGRGENQGPIALRIIELNNLANKMNRAGHLEDAASMKIWNITFRCMSYDALHQYGVELWRTAESGFPEARQWLITRLEHAQSSDHQRDELNLRNALNLYNYVPPQFRNN